ncbi:MAG: ABC transporter ATP-binding protein [Thermoguttaceae bacterium]|jgi:zinc transport system ATP-binding protein
MAPSEEPVVEFRDVGFAYDGTPVLQGVNFVVRRNESLSIVGPNGGGKTTLLRLILGQLQPSSGQVRVFGQPPETARLRIGYMPQHANYDPLFPATVMDVVLMGRLGRGGLRGRLGWFSRGDRRAAIEALAQVHLEELARRPFAALSGGQRQRVLVARALCCQPELLLLDEPTASVDSLVEARLFDILRELGRTMTVLVVSHDLGFVADLVEKVICVNRQVVVHPTSQITGELIRAIYGGDVRMVRHSDVLCQREHVHE